MGAGVAITASGCKKTPPPPPPEITALEPYNVRAKIVSAKTYPDYWAPMDVFLAWGELLDHPSTKQTVVIQADRRGHWFPPKDSPAYKRRDLACNTHLIATDDETRQEILSLRQNQTIYLRGTLVEAKFASGKTMRSSLSRTDDGGGACEVVLVKSLQILPDAMPE